MAEPFDTTPIESIVRPESPLGTILSTDAEDDGATTPGEDGIGLTSTFGSFDTTPMNNDDPLSSQIRPGPAAKTVTTARKHELLLMARADRVRWIYQVPLPYQTVSAAVSPLETFLEHSHASRYLPSAKGILKHLYGQNTYQYHDKPNALLTGEMADDLYPSGQQILQHELAQAHQDPIRLSTLKQYASFLNFLEETGAALVQGIRSFCRNFNTIRSDREVAMVQMQTYLKATQKSVPDTASLESFVFGHCRSTVEQLVQVQGQSEFKDKLESLSFIEATHLDIKIQESLLPVQALQSVDSFHSIYEKLQRILQVYHGVNQALKAVDQSKLPSADDVLPGIIYTVIRAQPAKLLWNLKFIEEWSPPEYLRGEAGYAFTNLFGAVQFLQDLKDPTSLSISEDEFNTKMAACRQAIAERQQKTEELAKVDVLKETTTQQVSEARMPSATEIRQARKRGEIINLAWALAWQKGLPPPLQETLEAPPVANERRQYSFLASRPEDIRLKDLPDLLGEYRDLFEAMERLRTERATESSRARRKQNDVTERDLIEVARSLNLL